MFAAAAASEPCPSDQLAYLGLCMEVNHDDPYAELERLSLLTPDAATWRGRLQDWLPLL
jgi:hypothetical protein